MRTFFAIALLVLCSVNATSQQLSRQTRVQEITTSFTKHKHVVKEKYGLRREKYKDVVSEAVVRPTAADYAGTYEAQDFGFVINVQVGSDGRIQANGSENGSRSFKLNDARIEGALLTATKVYSDGTREKFEGVFMTRTERNSPNDAGVTRFGLGVVLVTPVEHGGSTFDKLFYELKR
jgi:hypothetical protein